MDWLAVKWPFSFSNETEYEKEYGECSKKIRFWEFKERRCFNTPLDLFGSVSLCNWLYQMVYIKCNRYIYMKKKYYRVMKLLNLRKRWAYLNWFLKLWINKNVLLQDIQLGDGRLSAIAEKCLGTEDASRKKQVASYQPWNECTFKECRNLLKYKDRKSVV